MSEENVNLFRKSIERFKRGDVAGALRYMHPEIRFEHRLAELQAELTGIDAVGDWFLDASRHHLRFAQNRPRFLDLRWAVARPAAKPTSSPTVLVGIERVEVTGEHRADQPRRHPVRPHRRVQSKPVEQSV